MGAGHPGQNATCAREGVRTEEHPAHHHRDKGQ